jgi:hypothetical protein
MILLLLVSHCIQDVDDWMGSNRPKINPNHLVGFTTAADNLRYISATVPA